jgi:cyclopropane-fatty-acyl-phospholipid synthase
VNADVRPPRLWAPWSAAVMAVLSRLRSGTLSVTLPDGSERVFSGEESGPVAAIEILDPRVARRVALGGSVAFAECYMDGSWNTPDLDALLDLGVANMPAYARADRVSPLRPLRRLRHAGRDNDLAGARRNIEYHYDLGNEFYELWLDETMTYSAACFDDGETQLAQAQRRKWDHVLELLQPGRGDRILEIGCGWGGFAVYAATQAGCRVTGLTLSREQAAAARAHVTEHGLEDRVEICLKDYREETGTYRGIASIEMFEAVGEKWWPTFFGSVKGLLEAGRPAALQVITIPDERFEDYRRRPDFIQRYIFPGGMLPSPERFTAAAQAAGLSADEPRFFGRDYARTLAGWAERFEAALPGVRGLGFDERFVRMWRYYLAYCRAGFEAGLIDVMQVRLTA